MLIQQQVCGLDVPMQHIQFVGGVAILMANTISSTGTFASQFASTRMDMRLHSGRTANGSHLILLLLQSPG